MTQSAVLSNNFQRTPLSVSVSAFSLLIRSCWAIVVAATIVSELAPFPLLPKPVFYPIWAAKLVCFAVIGYLTPLAFWRFNALNRGLLYSTLSATLVETLQAIVGHGHSFHWYELVVKLVLILFGFSLGLDARYERHIKLPFLTIILREDHPARPLFVDHANPTRH